MRIRCWRFSQVDCFFGETEFGRCACLHLHDDERRPVPGDQVELARPVLGMPVPSNDHVAQFLQKAMREIFTASAPGVRGITSAAAAPCAGANRSVSKEAASFLDQAPFDHFPAHHEAEIVLPKPAEARKRIDQQLETRDTATMLVASRGPISHGIARENSNRSRRHRRRNSGAKSCSGASGAWDRKMS